MMDVFARQIRMGVASPRGDADIDGWCENSIGSMIGNVYNVYNV